MTIDIHGHVTSPELFERYPMPRSLADIDGMIERKSALGITTTIIGSPVGAGTMVPVPGVDNYDQPPDQLENFHEWVAETVRDHATHLRAYAYVNPFADDGSLDRAAERLAQDEFVGIIANTSVRGEFLDTERAEPFFAMAAQTRSPILLHPPARPAAGHDAGIGFVEHIARPCDITMGVAAVLLGGWLNRFPDLVLIAPNAGGALALLTEKLVMAHRRNVGGRPGPAGDHEADVATDPGVSLGLSRLYVDTATPSRAALHAAATTFGPSRMLFGTDSPPLATPLARALDMVGALDIDAAARARILGGTAAALFGLGDLVGAAA